MYNNDFDPNMLEDVLRHLIQEFGMTEQGAYLQCGLCPDCKDPDRSLYTSVKRPYQLICNRTNNCGSKFTVRKLKSIQYLFQNFDKRYPITKTDPLAPLKAYLIIRRGFDPAITDGEYTISNTKNRMAIRFKLANGSFWEKYISHIPGKKDESFEGVRQGSYWVPKSQTIEQGDTVIITEGIFKCFGLMHINDSSGKRLKVASAMSSNTFPSDLFKMYRDMNICWVWALDSDASGLDYLPKHYKRLKAIGE